MIKEKIVPEHKEPCLVCDFCGEEINDSSHTAICFKSDHPDMHFHHIHTFTAGGFARKTCFEKYSAQVVINARRAFKNNREES